MTQNIKRILLVSALNNNLEPYTYASSFASTLRLLGFDVTPFNTRQIHIPFTSSTYHHLSPLLRHANDIFTNKKFVALAQQLHPDLIFMIKAENITFASLRTIKNTLATRLINFYPDNPFTFWNGNSNEQVLRSLPLYDHFLIWTHALVEPLRAAGCRHVSYFPFAFDEKIFYNTTKVTYDEEVRYASDVCFIGTWEKERAVWLEKIVAVMPGINLAVWGNDWSTHLASDSPLRKHLRGNAIYGHELLKAFKYSKIILNFIRPQNMDAHNMRTFEVPATHSFLLTQRTHEQAQLLFKEGESIECFNSLEELLSKVAYYTTHESARNSIAAKGFLAAQKFTLHNQLKNVMSSLTKANV